MYHGTKLILASGLQQHRLPLAAIATVAILHLFFKMNSSCTTDVPTADVEPFFDLTSDPMCILDERGCCIQVNQSFFQKLGYSTQAMRDRSLASLAHANDSAYVQTQITRLVAGEPTVAFTHRHLCKEAQVRWLNWTVSRIETASGLRFYGIAKDITQYKEALHSLKLQKDSALTANMVLARTMRELEKRNAELDQFAYVASHDLKAPLRAIANIATWIEEDLEGKLPEENVKQLELLKSRVHRMEGLINGLLEYSRIGRTHQSSEQVDVAELIKTVTNSLPTEGFDIAIAPGMPLIQAKRSALSQVFTNLIGNAIKHHHCRSGTIEISVDEAESAYQFTVKDDGPGIDAAFHKKIFAIFQTLRARDELESTGIGLALVQKIVLAEGGDIQLFSEEGKGATFQFTWPKVPKREDEY